MPATRRKPSLPRNKTAKRRSSAASPKCSPTSDKGYTCYQSESLMKMKERWNKRHPDDKIANTDARGVWSALRHKLADVCDSEKCWLQQDFMEGGLDNTLKHYTFAPDQPKTWKKNPDEWLTSTEMIKVMKQYERKYKCFEFIGPSPIDFDKHLLYGECVWDQLCNFSLSKLMKRGKTKIGVIFNTDPHWKEGSHWISLFINMRAKKPYIYFFDSNGDPEPPEVRKFMTRVVQQAKAMGIEMEQGVNEVEHQATDSECGMYSLFFIIQNLIDGISIKDFGTKRIPDATVAKLRSIYFNAPSA